MLVIPLSAIAQEDEKSTAEIQEELLTNPDQINPDSALYIFDIFFDDIALIFQADEIDRAKLAIIIADERLTETKIMIDENKIPDAEEAQLQHDRILTIVQTSVANIELPDGFDEIRAKIEVENRLEKHKIRIEAISEELELEIRVDGQITDEQRQLIRMVLSELEGTVGEVEIRIDNEKDRTRIRIETETGETEIRIDNRIRDIEEEEKLPEVEIEFQNGFSKIEVETNTIETEFTLQTEDIDEIFAEIQSRTGLTREQILEVVEFEESEVDKIDNNSN